MIVHGIINDDTRILTNYPFLDTCDMMSNEGVFIPPDVFFDASIYITENDHRVYISKIDITYPNFIIEVRDFSGKVYTTPFPTQNGLFGNPLQGLSRDYKTFSFFMLKDDADNEAGVIGVDFYKLQACLNKQKIVTFNYESMAFVPSVLVPIRGNEGVNSFSVGSFSEGGVNTKRRRSVSDEVWFIGGTGINIGTHGNKITINAVGEFLYRRLIGSNFEVSTDQLGYRVPLKGFKIVGKNKQTNEDVLSTIVPNIYGDISFSLLSNLVDDPGNSQLEDKILNNQLIYYPGHSPTTEAFERRRIARNSAFRITERTGSVDLFLMGNVQ